MTGSLDFETLVNLHYAGLYRFALSLTRNETEARDLTQQTFYVWAAKGHQLQDPTKVKSWLYTTLHREFLGAERRHNRFPHYELMEVSDELPNVTPSLINKLDAGALLDCLARLDPIFQAPVALFYLEEHSYKEIAGILDIPLGTVKSRIARGIGQLQHAILERASTIARPQQSS
jgi:RNA polymerase sigma-70 factor, ECF subfamily